MNLYFLIDTDDDDKAEIMTHAVGVEADQHCCLDQTKMIVKLPYGETQIPDCLKKYPALTADQLTPVIMTAGWIDFSETQ